MGFDNPDLPWGELERKLSGRPSPVSRDGGDSPAWSRKRGAYQPPQPDNEARSRPTRRGPQVLTAYSELHCHSNFSFLDGASHPEELAEEAARLGLETVALTDHDGFYGVVRFAEAAEALGVGTAFGAELSLGLAAPQNGVADPEGSHLVVLARDPEGYRRLGLAITAAQRAGEKGRPVYDLESLAAASGALAGGGHSGGGRWAVLTGCRKGAVRAGIADSEAAVERELGRLVDMFGRDNVFVELIDHGGPLDSAHNDMLSALAAKARLAVVATNNVHYATPRRAKLAAALAAVRARRSVEELDGWLPPMGAAHLRSGAEMAARFERYPGAVARAAELGRDCAFDLRLVAPRLPDFPVPPGHTEMSWLRELTAQGALRRYGPRGAERVKGAYAQIDHELEVIEALGFPGYFLVVHDIVQFCHRNGILCQGRGSAANSAVCFAIGITAADAVTFGLLFERFLSPERDGPPDIDVDIESDRREEAIQYVYERYGRDRAAQVANVICYRPRSAVRDVAKALGYAQGQQDAWSKQLDGWSHQIDAGLDHDIPADVATMAGELLEFPRHLGIHSGGMVICDRPVGEVCPVEWARMPGRTVLQWDKDDCARVGLVKFDMLGLGMLSAIRYALEMLRDHHGLELELATIPTEDPAVYDMICAADTVGVFQVESRAQMATLPRSKPRCFYDLVTAVAIIRPGPIQGGSVHPYIRRRNGLEPVTYAHPLLERSLARTYGVPLFQEQVMQMAIDVAGFTPAESDELRQAMGSKRSKARMAGLHDRLYAGMAANGVVGAVADEIFEKLHAFASFGFPESHSISFAYLVYASSWLKLHYPAAFCAALLNAQPMGFYSPQTLVADARRHGVEIRPPDVNASGAVARLEGPRDVPVVRLGLSSVRSIGKDLAERIEAGRIEAGRVEAGRIEAGRIEAGRIEAGRPYTSMEDLAFRVGLTAPQAESLATAGAFACFGLTQREALWAAGAVAQVRPDVLAGTTLGTSAPMLPGLTDIEKMIADLWATGITADGFPTEHVRGRLDEMGVLTSRALKTAEPGRAVLVGGVVTHWQRPATAAGITFLNLEDETGMINVICSRGLWARFRRVARSSAALIVRGKLERADGVVNILAERIEALPLGIAKRSRDFH